MSEFKPSHADGRSDRQVIFDAVSQSEPDKIFPYDQLIEALSVGLEEPATLTRTQAAVRSANRMLLVENSRYLMNVRGSGYRMVRSDEHLPIAMGKKHIARRMMKRSVEILRNTRLDELDDHQKAMHESQLMLTAGVCSMMDHTEKRQNDQEQAIDNLRTRLEILEA